MYIGAAYYPELWEREEIERDISRCREYGINLLRVGEFAWEKLETREGKFDFDWLEDVINRLWQAGISVLLCTPTSTPPRWMFAKYPEITRMGADGSREVVSSRNHVCRTSPLMREKNRTIVEALAERFGHHPGVIGWQIDNELFPYQSGCFCPQCRAAFRDFLRERFGTIDALNRHWGMTRWSLSYASFEEIEPPRPSEWRHPSLRTAWRTFQCRQIETFAREQADILHRLASGPVGTDMMPNNVLSYYRMNAPMDVVQFNHYDPAAALPDLPFSYHFLRPIKSAPFWVTETQVGWNGSEFAENGARPVGNCYANTMLPFLMGAEANLFWLFRTHPNGHEFGARCALLPLRQALPRERGGSPRGAGSETVRSLSFAKPHPLGDCDSLFHRCGKQLRFRAAPQGLFLSEHPAGQLPSCARSPQRRPHRHAAFARRLPRDLLPVSHNA